MTYSIEIAAPAEKVWEIVLCNDMFTRWIAKRWPNSRYKSSWKKGEKIKLIGPSGGGLVVELADIKLHERILVHYIAVLLPDGREDRTSLVAASWIGTTEEYKFIERAGGMTLTVSIKSHQDLKKLFDDGWPAALQELKLLVERQT
jgi:uncharacterized protein YndB with AHSA1/START domain